jgi:hypothetical protein
MPLVHVVASAWCVNFAAGTARAVDRGQFENISDDIRAWFKGVRSRDGATRWTSNYLRRTRRTLLGTNRRRVVANAREGGHSKRR